jgi:repressor LexA
MLTTKQKKLLKFIEDYSRKHFCTPTHREMRNALNIVSSAYLDRTLKRLEELKFIKRNNKGIKRNIELLCSPYSILITSEITEDLAIRAIVPPEEIILTHKLLNENRYLIRVKGESMMKENICDGDLLICERCQKISDGAVVVVLIDKRKVTVKKIYYKKNKIYLLPVNMKLKTQIYKPEEVEIQGKFVGLIRLVS